MLKRKWPEHTNTRGQGLLEQNLYVRTACRRAIKFIEKGLVTVDAWPELHRAAEYRVEVLSKATKELKTQDPKYNDLRERIKNDEDYSAILGKWVRILPAFISDLTYLLWQVVDRLPIARGPIRVAVLDHIAVFQLGIGDVCALRVRALLESDTYMYPGHWEEDENKLVRSAMLSCLILSTDIINVVIAGVDL